MSLYTDKEWLESSDFPFNATIYPFQKHEFTEPHSHEFIELAYVAEGDGEHEYRGVSYPVTAGDVLVIEPNIEHSYQSGETNLLVYNVILQPVILSAELETLFKVTPFVDFFFVEPFLRKYVDFQSHLNLEPQEHIEMLFRLDRLVKEHQTKELGYRIVIKTLLIEIFIFLSRCYERRIHKPMSTLGSEEEIIRHICEFIEMYHARPLSLTQVCQLCGMSQSSFSTKFKQQVGQTFVEFRNQIRIKVAKELLAKSEDKILNIGQQIGFEDLSFFNKTFKKAVGLSPGEYRKKHKRE
ncbi:MAG: AraC family transcriptional regulator [Bacilli bacterium]|nr:AraC family transcriptional regulator [Bacilli bacterium]